MKIFWRVFALLLALTGSSQGLAGSSTTDRCVNGAKYCGDPPFDIGPLPASLAGLRWPVKPVVTVTTTVSTHSDLVSALRRSGQRIIVQAGRYNGFQIGGADQEIVFMPGANIIGEVTITQSQSRTRISGGHWSGGHFYILGARDLLIDGMTRDTSTSNHEFYLTFLGRAFGGRGSHRVAIINSTYRGRSYFGLTQDGGADFTQDIIYANNDLQIANTVNSLVRWMDVSRGVIVDSRLASSGHHTFRAHFNTRDIWIARNQIEGAGAMIGPNPGPTATDGQIGMMYFDLNRWYHVVGNALLARQEAYPRILGVRITNNDVWATYFNMFDQRITGPNDFAQNNRHMGPPQTPPPFTGGAR